MMRFKCLWLLRFWLAGLYLPLAAHVLKQARLEALLRRQRGRHHQRLVGANQVVGGVGANVVILNHFGLVTVVQERPFVARAFQKSADVLLVVVG